LLYQQQSEVFIKPLDSISKSDDKVKATVSDVVRQVLKDEPEQHRVMYQYMFVENKKKKSDA